jgi:hypothetical protein
MSTTVKVEYYGLKEALRELNKTDPKLRKEVGKELRGIVEKTMIPGIVAAIPGSAPTRGMRHSGRTGWKKANQQAGVVAKVDTRKARRRNLQKGAQWESVGTVVVRTKTAALAITDMAGKGPNKTRNQNPKMARPNFADVLTSKLGRGPSRYIWFGGEANLDETSRALNDVIKRVMTDIEKNIVRRT